MSFFSDLRRTNWLLTGKLAIARGFAAGLVMMVIAIANGGMSDSVILTLTLPFWMALLSPAIGFGAQSIAQALGIFGDNAFTGIIGLAFQVIAWFFTVIGDPIVYLINRMVPDLLEIADFGLFNWNALILVLNPE